MREKTGCSSAHYADLVTAEQFKRQVEAYRRKALSMAGCL